MVPLETNHTKSIWDSPDQEDQRCFYDSPPRMDVSVCCLQPTAGSGLQQHPPQPQLHHHHHHHTNNHHHHHHNHQIDIATNVVQQNGQNNTYQYADQIVPDRGQPDGLAIVNANTGQDNATWQNTNSSGNAGINTTTAAYIDYSWLQMQVSF
uniref:Uncharacterized protein n=1 Tax=Bracon brevicornis TaxID=1563983 RepID=A0A6V7I465_9HYME